MNSKNTMRGLALEHTGTVLSCRVQQGDDQKSLLVFLKGKTGDSLKPDVTIRVRGRSPINLFCPSVEGTVIWCRLVSGEERFYETRTGKRLTPDELKKMSKAGKLHIYT